MQVIWHEDVSTYQPRVGTVPDLDQRFVYTRIGEPRPAVLRAYRDEDWAVASLTDLDLIILQQFDHLAPRQQHRAVAVDVVGGGAVIVVDVVVGVIRADAHAVELAIACDVLR